MSEAVRVDDFADQDPLAYEPVVGERYSAYTQTGDDLTIMDEESPDAWILVENYTSIGGEFGVDR